MSTFKCKMCDAILNVREGTNVCKCEYCGTWQTITIDDDDVEAAYKLAVKLMCDARSENDYRQAAEQFRSVSGYKDADELRIKCEELAGEKKIKTETVKANDSSETKGSSGFYIFAAIPIVVYLIVSSIIFSSGISSDLFEGVVLIAIMLIANIISIYYCSYMYYFMGSNQDFSSKFWTSIVFDNFLASGIIYIIMSNVTDKLYGEKFFIVIFVISAIISFISGYRGYKSGENEVRNNKGNKK